MKNWIAILAILLVALSPVALAEETGSDTASDSETGKTPREQAKDRLVNAKGEMREAKTEVREAKRALRLETRDEIRALRDQVKAACEADKASEECKNARMDAREGKHTLLGRIAEKMGPTFKRAEQLEKRLTRIVEHLAKKGKDASGLDTSAIKAKIAEAQGLFDEGKKLFEDARAAEAGSKDELMKQAAQKFRDANKALKEARALIGDWLKSVRQKDPKAIEESSSTTETAPAATEAPATESTEAPSTESTEAPEAEETEAPEAEETEAPESTEAPAETPSA